MVWARPDFGGRSRPTYQCDPSHRTPGETPSQDEDSASGPGLLGPAESAPPRGGVVKLKRLSVHWATGEGMSVGNDSSSI